jgi:glycosyltransferase involved in cell wall biosynthesis
LLDKQDNIFVLPNFIEVLPKSKSENDEEYIVYAGRISKEKGVEELIRSFVDSTLVKVKLKIIGDGPELTEFKKKYENENVIFLGEMENKEVLKLISNSKAVVTATKLYEGQPTLLCEASSMGIVSIFPRTGGISEFFPEQYPFAFKQFDYRDLTQKLSSLQNYENHNSIGENNMEFIANYLSKELLAEKFKELINEE